MVILISKRNNLKNPRSFKTVNKNLELKNLFTCKQYMVTVRRSEQSKMTLRFTLKETITAPFNVKHDVKTNKITWEIKRSCVPFTFHVFYQLIGRLSSL